MRNSEARKLGKHEVRYLQGLLYSYPLMKKELAELEHHIEAVRGDISSPRLDDVRVKGAIGDPTSKRAFRTLRLKAAWEHKAFFVKAIEDTLKLLKDEKRAAMEQRYFKDL